jgi:hypothetical protein
MSLLDVGLDEGQDFAGAQDAKDALQMNLRIARCQLQIR